MLLFLFSIIIIYIYNIYIYQYKYIIYLYINQGDKYEISKGTKGLISRWRNTRIAKQNEKDRKIIQQTGYIYLNNNFIILLALII